MLSTNADRAASVAKRNENMKVTGYGTRRTWGRRYRKLTNNFFTHYVSVYTTNNYKSLVLTVRYDSVIIIIHEWYIVKWAVVENLYILYIYIGDESRILSFLLIEKRRRNGIIQRRGPSFERVKVTVLHFVTMITLHKAYLIYVYAYVCMYVYTCICIYIYNYIDGRIRRK